MAGSTQLTAGNRRSSLPRFSGEVRSTPRVAVFVDGCNFFYMQKDNLRWFVDPRKLLHVLSGYGDIVDATYYTTLDHNNEGQVNFLRALEHMGYTVPEPQSIYESDDCYNTVDIRMMLEMITQMPNYDLAVVISGDYAFTEPLKILRNCGKRFMVLGAQGCTSTHLQKMAGMHYVDLADWKKDIVKS